MGPIYLFDVASQQARWLSARQAVVASNVANANTPRFKARDVEPFSKVMDKTALTMTATNAAHMGVDANKVRSAKVNAAESWSVSHSGNSVSLEQELTKAGEINRHYSLNTAIVKSFHRMLLSSVKAGS